MTVASSAPAARLAALALVVLVSACAATPTGPTSSLPDKVIRNVPAARKAAAATPAAQPLLVPLHDELPPTPVVYADVLERIRTGLQLPDVDHPSVDAEFNWYVRNGDYMARVFGRAQRYLFHIANEVEARGLPMELALLPVVESAFNPFAYSRSHASGLWQFIPGTGKLFELKQDWWQDQRRDVLDSTRAALDYLTYLNGKFDGDWLLAVAAYNYGGGNVNRAIERNRALGRDTGFFSLSLPGETRAYVPKLLALSRLVRDPRAYGVTLPPVANAPYFTVIDTGGPVDLRLAAELAGIDVEELHALNAGWNQWVTAPEGPHRLLVPQVVAEGFQQQLASLQPSERAGLSAYTAAPGDTFERLAEQHRVPASFLQSVNGTNGATLAAGDPVFVPARDVSPLRSGLVRAATAAHTVRPGDTLWGISRRYGMSVGELSRANGLNSQSILRPGQKLAVRPGSATGGTVRTAAAPDVRRIEYKVRRGDTLSSIARRFEVSVRQLQAWNGMQGRTSIRAGQRLTIEVEGTRNYGG